MTRIMGTALTGALALLQATVVIAQSDPIATRMALMKENNDNMLIVIAMARGQMPFDPIKVDSAFAQWADTAKKFPELFPGDSQIGQDTRAASMIWVNKKDFDARAMQFGKIVADNREKAKASLVDLRAAIPAIGKVCDECHKDYRTARR